MSLNRRHFITIYSLSLFGLGYGCSTLITGNNYYTETVSSVLISQDGKKLVIITADHHYIFDAPQSIVSTLRSDFHKYVFGQFETFYVKSSHEISGEFTLRLNKIASEQQKKQALEAGYERQPDGSMKIITRIKGQRFESGGIEAVSDTQKLNRTYLISVTEESSKAVEAMLTPIRVIELSLYMTVAAGSFVLLVSVGVPLHFLGITKVLPKKANRGK